ncbi:hypothetical protein DFH08DRAFT_860656 [Mycena albidolilacea]|uniref:Uncharacterized protein n=1 Tax=Mycena albidolilacea TaxID=1033008 RepID=A0AAD7A831_9AGAR|nr:hypothetical protein DFH08DRAFT_860656 [Mycena albidolilacea]
MDIITRLGNVKRYFVCFPRFFLFFFYLLKPFQEGYREQFLTPSLEVERFLYTVSKVAVALAKHFENLFEPDKHPLADFSCFLALKPEPSIVKTLLRCSMNVSRLMGPSVSRAWLSARPLRPSATPLTTPTTRTPSPPCPTRVRLRHRPRPRTASTPTAPRTKVLPTNVASPIGLSSSPMLRNGTTRTTTSLRRRRRPSPRSPQSPPARARPKPRQQLLLRLLPHCDAGRLASPGWREVHSDILSGTAKCKGYQIYGRTFRFFLYFV